MEYITKENYLNSRVSWRRDYKHLGTSIRTLKTLTVEAAKGGFTAATRLQSARALMSNDAHKMMIKLDTMKELARNSVEEDRKKFLNSLGTFSRVFYNGE